MRALLAQIIASSLHNMFQAEPDLSQFVPQETREREPNLSFHLATQLRKYLFWLNCDFDVTKREHENKRPDIIFHKRGVNALNFLVVETKRARNRREVPEDLVNIRNHWFTGNLHYDFGASVLIDETARTFAILLLARGQPGNPDPITNATHPQAQRLPAPTQAACQPTEALATRIVAAARDRRAADVTDLKRQLTAAVIALYRPPA